MRVEGWAAQCLHLHRKLECPTARLAPCASVGMAADPVELQLRYVTEQLIRVQVQAEVLERRLAAVESRVEWVNGWHTRWRWPLRQMWMALFPEDSFSRRWSGQGYSYAASATRGTGSAATTTAGSTAAPGMLMDAGSGASSDSGQQGSSAAPSWVRLGRGEFN